MPAVSQKQFKLMKAAANNPEFAKKVGITQSAADEFTKENKGKKRFSRLKNKLGKK